MTARRRSSSRLAWSVALLCAAAALAAGLGLWRARSAQPSALHSFILPPEKTAFELTGDESAPPAISPDGERIVFGASGKLWTQSLSNGRTTALPSTERGLFPFWSPDSRSIGFFAGGKLKTIDAAGGPAQVLCDAPVPRGGSWGRGGDIVFAADFRGGLSRVPAGGGNPVAVTKLDSARHTTHRWPWFLPDGKRFLYLAADHANPKSQDSAIYVGSLDGGQDRRLMASYGSVQTVPGWLLTVRDNNLMAMAFDEDRATVVPPGVGIAGDANFDAGVWRGVFTASRNGLLAYQLAREGSGGQLTWFDMSGHTTGTLGERGESYAMRLSPDGRRATVIQGDPNNDIWIYELERGVRTRLTTNAQVLPSPLWSPDGSEIAFTGGAALAQTPDYVVSTVPSFGAGEKKVVFRSTVRVETTDWSRDGRYLLYDRGNIGATDIWAVALAQPDKPFALVQTPFVDTGGVFSPDGRWVAYVSMQTGTWEIFVTAFPAGGAPYQVSASGGRLPVWSADGKTIYFVGARDELTSAEVDGSGPRFEIRTPKPLFPLPLFIGPRLASAYAIVPDGKRILANAAPDLAAPRIAFVANWTSGLTK